MGAFIPVKVEDPIQSPDYAEELEQFKQELKNNNTLQLSQFCSSRAISYQGFRGYLENNGVNLRQLRMSVGRKRTDISGRVSISDMLSNVSIKLPNQVELTIPSVLPSQLSDLLRLL